MNFLTRSAVITVFACIALPTVQAEEVAKLPTIRIMAESEMREEVGPIPFQEDEQVRQTLQHYLYKVHNNIQNTDVPETTVVVDGLPMTAKPDLSQLSPVLQEYILAVAAGLQSPDPTTGLFTMLQPLNINRNNADGFRNGSIKINIDDILKLQQQIRDGLNGPQSPLFTR